MIYAEASDMMGRVESYWRMFEVAPPEMQWILGVAAVCTAGVLAKVGWRVSAPLRWAVGRAGVAVSRRVVKAGGDTQSDQKDDRPSNSLACVGRIERLEGLASSASESALRHASLINEQGDSIHRLIERIECLENEVGRRLPTDAMPGYNWIDSNGNHWRLSDEGPPQWCRVDHQPKP